jgi:hypothetical protein
MLINYIRMAVKIQGLFLLQDIISFDMKFVMPDI